MPTSEKQKIWIVLDHPMQLATALDIASHWGREKFILNLLISPHSYWQKVDISPYKAQFDEVIFLDRPDYIPNPIPEPLKIFKILCQKKKVAQLKGQLGNIAVGQSILHCLQGILLYPIHLLQWIVRILRLKKRVAQLRIQPTDIIIGLSIFHYLENIVLSMHPQNLKIAIMPNVVYEESIRPVDKSIYKNTLEGWLANWIVEPITGLYRTHCLKERLLPQKYWWIRYRSSLLEIFDKVVVLGDFSNQEIQSGDNLYTMPFPYVLALKSQEVTTPTGKPQKVVVFGTTFTTGKGNIAPEVYTQNMNACLSFIREKYGSTYKLVYRPHPTESDEIKLLDLDQFEVENDGMLAELYFYRNIENIYAVFSVVSTTSRAAFHFFINAYLLLNIFPFDEEWKNYFRGYMGNVPDDFYINDLSITPNRYIKTEDMNEAVKKCQSVLDAVVKK